MFNQRIYIAVSITLLVTACLYLKCLIFLFMLFNLAITYDVWYMVHISNVNKIISLIFYLSMCAFNTYLLLIYNMEPFFLLQIAFVTQVSDIYQYIAGQHWGKNKIGWISKNKSYEGYIVGYLFTIITFVPILISLDYYLFFGHLDLFSSVLIKKFVKCTVIYILGIIGGLLSSFFKRMTNIKDYSDLLGAHGGWTDRIDSIILPMLLISF